jgi:hypothetical protein
MGVQDVGVFLIVASAVVFLVLRVVPRRSDRAETFVPIEQLKRRRDDKTNCH